MREDLSDEDVNRLDNVRKQIWAAGYSGFFIGGAVGLGNCIIYKASVYTAVYRDVKTCGKATSGVACVNPAVVACFECCCPMATAIMMGFARCAAHEIDRERRRGRGGGSSLFLPFRFVPSLGLNGS